MSQDNPFAPAGQQAYGQQTVGLSAVPSSAAAPVTSAAGSDLIKETSTAGFQADVIAESRNQPVLIDFWAPWCGPCKQLTPIIEAAVKAAGGKVKLVKMNIDEHPAIAGQMGIQSIPAVIAFANGQPIDGFMGAKPESEVKAFIDRVVSKGGGAVQREQQAAVDEAMKRAGDARQAGDINRAAQIYSTILQHEPDNAAAYGAMAGLLLDAGQKEQAVSMLDQAPDMMADAPELQAVRARIALEEKVAALGDPAALAARLQANGDDHDARFDLAQIANARGDRDAAADGLLAIMKADRQWRDDGARKELLTFFEAWGPTDPATVTARRKLSSLLFR